ncbi:MAG: hypothetical protein PHF25_03700 [Candidatus Margulisbacteria bacterium]|nr:hypothetical protein [Candidatus Margulisiibacteriota bacterium]
MSLINNSSTNNVPSVSGYVKPVDTNKVTSSGNQQLGSFGLPQSPYQLNIMDVLLSVGRPKNTQHYFIGRDSKGDILIVVDNPYKAAGYVPKVYANDNVEYTNTSDVSSMTENAYPGIETDSFKDNNNGTVTVTLPSERELTNIGVVSSPDLSSPFTKRNDAVISYAFRKYSATLPKLASDKEFYKFSFDPSINANQHVICLKNSAFVNPNTVKVRLVVPEPE